MNSNHSWLGKNIPVTFGSEENCSQFWLGESQISGWCSKHIPSCLGIYWSHGAYGSEVDFWWWIDHATTSPSVTWQIFEQVDFSDKHPEWTSQAIFPPEVLCLIGMFLGCLLYRSSGGVWWMFGVWKMVENPVKKEKRCTRIKPVGIGLMDWFFRVYFP